MTAGSLTGEGEVDQVQGGIVGYEGPQNFSEYGGGSKRRKRGKRNSRKRSQRKSKKYMKKMYRGGAEEDQQTEETPDQVQTEPTPENKMPDTDATAVGGRRKSKKMRKGKMTKGKMTKSKTRKGKVSTWITHVKNFAKTNKMDFRDALKDPKCKSSYHKMK